MDRHESEYSWSIPLIYRRYTVPVLKDHNTGHFFFSFEFLSTNFESFHDVHKTLVHNCSQNYGPLISQETTWHIDCFKSSLSVYTVHFTQATLTLKQITLPLFLLWNYHLSFLELTTVIPKEYAKARNVASRGVNLRIQKRFHIWQYHRICYDMINIDS